MSLKFFAARRRIAGPARAKLSRDPRGSELRSAPPPRSSNFSLPLPRGAGPRVHYSLVRARGGRGC